MEALELEEVEALREQLVRLREELQAQLASSEAAARPVDLSEPIGRVSRMDALQQQSMTQANRASAALRERQVEAALGRIERDEYGACLGCGEEVGFQRLKARPEAPFCLPCQSLRERREGG